MSNGIQDLRGHLFNMLQDLRDPNMKVDIDRYRLANDMAQTVINSAKVEVEFMRAVGGKSASGFIPHADGTGLPAPQGPGSE